MSKNLKRRPKRAQTHPKRTPESIPRPEMRPEKARRGLKEEAQDPHGAQEANQASKVSNSHRKIKGF